jgi:hypothetical protein
MSRRWRRAARWLLASVAFAAAAVPVSAIEPWPGALYDPTVPTLAAAAGHEHGAELTVPEDLNRYLAALAAAVPERARLVEYARSWEGRPLVYLAISAPRHIAALEDVRAGMARLADPRGASAAVLERLTAELPAVVWLAHGVHGNEVSSADAGLLTAYHLLADRSDRTARLLDALVVVIDPAQNPDGRARFVQHYRTLRGLEPQPSPIAAERVEPWPRARTNHYLFDMNRDWFVQTQPESQGRVRAFLDYFPVVHVDLHEMGTDSTYYFPPPAVPFNPYLDDRQHAMLETLGRAMADAFDSRGLRYYTREIFDAYYPGYGDTWPALQGAAGMTFEMASARGLAGQRSDGSLLSYRDGVEHHFVASMATLEASAAHRQRLLSEFLALRRSPPGDTVHVLLRRDDPGRVDKLADVLLRQGIEVRRLPEDGRLCGERVPAGSYLITTDQPAGRLAGTLLAPESPADAAFWAEQERRLARNLPVEVYDVVAWSLPLLFDVATVSCRTSLSRYPVIAATPPGPSAPVGASPAVAYLVPWGTQAAARFLAGALRDGLSVAASTRAFTQNERRYPRGTLIVRRADHGTDLAARVTALVSASGAEVIATDSGWVNAGVNLGSDHVRAVPASRVALGWGEPASVASAGALRFVLEQKLGYPVTPVWMKSLDSAWLDQFRVLVLPDGDGYDKVLDESAAGNLQRWVRGGGTLIAVGGALGYLGREGVGLLAARPEKQARAQDEHDASGRADGDSDENGNDGPVPGTILAGEADFHRALTPQDALPPEIPGVLAHAVTDPDHWLTAGLPPRLPFMLTGNRVFTPLTRDKGVNAIHFAAADQLVAAGYLWESVRPQIAFKPAVMVQPEGLGQVIAFTVDPAFRGMMDGLDVLLANAVLLGPAMAAPIPPAP